MLSMRVDSTKRTQTEECSWGKTKLKVQDVEQYENLCNSGKSFPISCLEYEIILSDVQVDIYL